MADDGQVTEEAGDRKAVQRAQTETAPAVMVDCSIARWSSSVRRWPSTAGHSSQVKPTLLNSCSIVSRRSQANGRLMTRHLTGWSLAKTESTRPSPTNCGATRASCLRLEVGEGALAGLLEPLRPTEPCPVCAAQGARHDGARPSVRFFRRFRWLYQLRLGPGSPLRLHRTSMPSLRRRHHGPPAAVPPHRQMPESEVRHRSPPVPLRRPEAHSASHQPRERFHLLRLPELPPIRLPNAAGSRGLFQAQ